MMHVETLYICFLIALSCVQMPTIDSASCVEEYLCMTSACPSEAKKAKFKEKIAPRVHINSLDVPTPLLIGDSVVLSCDYKLHENETLYAVKWYRNMGEFFRYVPRATPQFKVLLQPGVSIDLSESNENEVTMSNVTIETTGNFTCQVSTDRPYFHCVQLTKQLRVFSEYPPHIFAELAKSGGLSQKRRKEKHANSTNPVHYVTKDLLVIAAVVHLFHVH